MTLSNEIVKFANGNIDYYMAFADYHKNKEVASVQDHEALSQGFFAEVERVSGVAREGLATEAWVSHPSVQWGAMSVIDATINAILPQVLTPAFRLFMDFRFVGVGDIMKFKIQPNQLFTVSLGGNGERTTHRQKQFAGDVVVAPKEHLITVYVDMFRVLAGKEDIADFVDRIVLAIEQSMYKDALGALMTGLNAIPAGAYNVTGAFDPKALVKMCETVQAYNYGVRPVIAGSATALMNVLPDSTLGYRGFIDGNGGAVEVMKDFYGYQVIKLDNAAAGNDELVLPNDKLFVVSPAQDKLVKGVVSNSLTNSNQFYDNSDLTQNFTMRKMWDFVYASSAKAGIYTINE